MHPSQDIGRAQVIGGLPLELFERLGAHYAAGTNTSAVACYDFEPHVASKVVNEMLTEASVRVVTGAMLRKVTTEGGGASRRITSISTDAGTFAAGLFADGTYEGDLAAMAGADMTWGREGVAQFGESMAGVRPPDPGNRYEFQAAVTNYTGPSGALLPLIQDAPGPVGSPDARTQSYCYRLCMTTNLTNALPIVEPESPAGWEAQWELLRRYLKAWVASRGAVPALDDVVTIRHLPRGKADWNVGSAVNMDVVGFSWAWPNATYKEREAVQRFHTDYTKQLLWVLANDPAVPASIRESMAEWGYCADEFTDTGGFPPPLYVREARRLVGATVLMQQNRTQGALWPDTIGVGSYSTDCHMVTMYVGKSATYDVLQVWEEGELFPRPPSTADAFEIPFSCLVPRGAAPNGTSANPAAPSADAGRSGPRSSAGALGPANLIVPVAASASHVAFSSLRLEPTWMIMGQAAGTAAAQLTRQGGRDSGFGAVNVTQLQGTLRRQRAIVFAHHVPEEPVPNVCPKM